MLWAGERCGVRERGTLGGREVPREGGEEPPPAGAGVHQPGGPVLLAAGHVEGSVG